MGAEGLWQAWAQALEAAGVPAPATWEGQGREAAEVAVRALAACGWDAVVCGGSGLQEGLAGLVASPAWPSASAARRAAATDALITWAAWLGLSTHPARSPLFEDSRPLAAALAAALAVLDGAPEAALPHAQRAFDTARREPRVLQSSTAGTAADAAADRAVSRLRIGLGAASRSGERASSSPPLSSPDLETSTALLATLRLPRTCGLLPFTPALDALDEILQRHLRAAEKRLRADQIERVEISLAWPAFALARAGQGCGWLPADLPRAAAQLLARHALGPADASAPLSSPALALPEKITLLHNPGLTLKAAATYAQSTAAWRARLEGSSAPARARDALRQLQRDRALPRLRDLPSSTAYDLARAYRHLPPAPQPPAPQPPAWPVEVRLYTTRGGAWPERRTSPGEP